MTSNKTLRCLNDITLDDPNIYDDGVSVSRIHHHVHHHHTRADPPYAKHHPNANDNSAGKSDGGVGGDSGNGAGETGVSGGVGRIGEAADNVAAAAAEDITVAPTVALDPIDVGGAGDRDDVSMLGSPDQREVSSINTSHPPPDHGIDLAAHQSDGFQVSIYLQHSTRDEGRGTQELAPPSAQSPHLRLLDHLYPPPRS